MTNLPHNFEGESQHMPQEQFLPFVDGELEPRQAARWESHLEACWSCRVHVAKIQDTIADIVEFENTLSQSQFTGTDDRWGNFDAKLHAIAGEAEPLPFTARIAEFWKQHLHFPRVGPLGFATSGVAAVLIVALVYNFVLVAPVTAADVLLRSIDAQAEELGKVDQPVMRQSIKVTQLNGGEQPSPVSWEIWNDTANSRVKTASFTETSKPIDQPAVITDLRTILRINHMNEHRPLSAASYKNWSDTVTGKSEDVATDPNTLTVHTARTAESQNGQISEAHLAVRKNDYHPTSLYIKVKNSPAGDLEYELTEQDYAVVSLAEVDPAIFADASKLEVASTVGTKPETAANTASEPGTELSNSNVNANVVPATRASTAAEVEVLDLLHKVGADISEQISVTRTADGRLLVEGLVEGDGRKREILAALSPVANDPAVRIKIQTIEEATRALKQQKAQANSSVDLVEVEKGDSPADADLRRYFTGRGGDTDTEIRAFAGRAMGHAQSAAFQASALNRMANRFTASQLAELQPADRAKWIGILRGYAAAVRRESAALRSQLDPVFGGFSVGGGESVTSDADLIASAKRLYELTASNDRAVRAAFTLSSGGSTAAAIKTSAFRQNLAAAEDLAAAIERAR